MRIPSKFKLLLVDTIVKAFDDSQFQAMVNDSELDITYADVKLQPDTYKVTVGKYINEVWRQEKFGAFLQLLRTTKPNDLEVRKATDTDQQLFIIEKARAEINPRQFSRYLLKNQALLFIERDLFVESVAKMINRKEGVMNLITIQGQSQSGRSYIDKYFTDIGDELDCFKVIYLNLRDIGRRVPEGEVAIEHLVEFISIRLGLRLPGDGVIKYTQFLPALQNKFDSLEANDEEWLLFIDQFDYPHNPNVADFVRDLAKAVLNCPRAYLVFSAYDNWKAKWDRDDIDLTAELTFDSFTKEGIKQYLGCLYDSIDMKGRASRRAFIRSGLEAAEPKLKETTNGPNVSNVSSELRLWFRGLKKKYNI
jgi:hypothetical protein